MSRCLYSSGIKRFLSLDDNLIFGTLCDKYHGDAPTTTREAWKGEISVMKSLLSNHADKDGKVIFEYDIPRLGTKLNKSMLCRDEIQKVFKNG